MTEDSLDDSEPDREVVEDRERVTSTREPHEDLPTNGRASINSHSALSKL
jgi:hypothetical protein